MKVYSIETPEDLKENKAEKNKFLEREIIRKFLKMRVTTNSFPIPLKVKKVIKATKALLGKGRIFIVDQSGFEFGIENYTKIIEIFKKKKSNCTILIISKSYDKVLCSDKVLYMQNGKVKDFGDTLEIIRDKNSEFSKISFSNNFSFCIL